MNKNQADSFINNFQTILDSIYRSKPDSILILGDFNDKCLQWNSNHSNSELKNKFFDLIEGNNLHQMINEPTHIKDTSTSLLDLIITDSPAYMLNTGTWTPIGDPYHSTIFCRFQFLIKRNPKYKREIWKYDQCDFVALNEELSNAPWNVLDTFDDVNDAVDYFMTLFLNICRKHITIKTVTVNPKDKPWFNDHVKEGFKIRDKAHKKLKRNNSPENRANYRAARHDANMRKK
jgi:hypothetical protein